MSCPHRPRLPLAPLAPYLDTLAADHHATAGRTWAVRELTGMSRRMAVRYVAEGQIAEHHADAIAARLALHPSNIWPAEWAGLGADH